MSNARRTVRPENYLTCICGKVCKGRLAHANHGKKCPAEQERSAAFIAAIENGEDAVAASRAVAARWTRQLAAPFATDHEEADHG